MSQASTAAVDQPTSIRLAIKPRIPACTPPSSPSANDIASYPRSSDSPSTSLAPTARSLGSEQDGDAESSDYHYVCAENEEREGENIVISPTSQQLREFKSSLLVQMQAAALLRLLKDEMEHEENDESAEKSKDENDVVNGASEDVETIQKSSDDPTTMETNRINEYAKTQTNGTEAQMNEEDVLKDRPELTEVFRGITLMRRVLASEESQGGDESRDIDDIHPGCLPTPSGINTAATFDRDLPSAAEESTIPMAVGHMEQEQSNEAAKNTTPAISEAPSRSSDDAESRREVHGKMLESQLVFEDFISTYLENQFGKSSQQLLSDVFDFYPLQFGPGRPRTATVPIGMYDEEEEAQDSGVELDDVAYIRS